jgi:hypothetical protein
VRFPLKNEHNLYLPYLPYLLEELVETLGREYFIGIPHRKLRSKNP